MAEPSGAVADLLALLQRPPRPVVLIDGGSGAGKSTLATRLIREWPEAQLVRLDDVYPGWHGLEAASLAVREGMLDPVSPRWRRWDWQAGAPAEWHELDPAAPLIIEGSGSLSRANRARASHGIWIDLDEATRKCRALGRDGDGYAPHWEIWAEQERRFFERERPDLIADVTIAGLTLPGRDLDAVG